LRQFLELAFVGESRFLRRLALGFSLPGLHPLRRAFRAEFLHVPGDTDRVAPDLVDQRLQIRRKRLLAAVILFLLAIALRALPLAALRLSVKPAAAAGEVNAALGVQPTRRSKHWFCVHGLGCSWQRKSPVHLRD